ncbi:MAG: hypothetical protein P4L75_02375 [Clostridia bacterium]|nr:hypothetical protein [Clostridia bacterium]MDR3645386.1 hypothetical protein [Clostridia bacterium]
MNKPVLFLWISVNVSGPKQFRFKFPLALPVLAVLVDTLDDLESIYGLVWCCIPRRRRGWMPSPEGLRQLAPQLRGLLLGQMFSSVPYDLLDLETCGGGRQVAVKVYFR